MSRSLPRVVLAGFALAAFAGASPVDDRMSAADDRPLDPKRVSWRQLEYRASKLFVSARTHVDLAQVAPGVAEISFDTRALGRKTTDAIRFRLADADTLTRRKQKHGNNPYAKLYRFADEQVTMERSEPADVDEATGDLAAWSRRRTETFGSAPGACGRVVDPSVVLYLAAARGWQAGDSYSVCTFSDGRFSRLVIGVAGEEEIRVDYEIEGAGVSRRDETVVALVLELDAESLLGEGEDQLEVLGLEEDVRMYVDPQTGAPLRFTGKMDKLGSVEVELQRLTLR